MQPRNAVNPDVSAAENVRHEIDPFVGDAANGRGVMEGGRS